MLETGHTAPPFTVLLTQFETKEGLKPRYSIKRKKKRTMKDKNGVVI